MQTALKNYLGSKGQAGVFQRIIGNMPPHSVYVEPFLGSGKIMRTKLPADRNVGIDAAAVVVKSFRQILASEPTLRSAEIICGDALAILPTLALPDDAVVYCDPPYVLSTRTSRHRYAHEMTDEQHVALLTLLQEMKCRVLISGYPSALYKKHLRDWWCDEYQTRTRGRTLTECLWQNFPRPQELHDWRFAGWDYRQRLQLKRRAARLTAKLDALTPRARGFVLHAIHSRYFRRGVPAARVGKDAPR